MPFSYLDDNKPEIRDRFNFGKACIHGELYLLLF